MSEIRHVCVNLKGLAMKQVGRKGRARMARTWVELLQSMPKLETLELINGNGRPSPTQGSDPPPPWKLLPTLSVHLPYLRQLVVADAGERIDWRNPASFPRLKKLSIWVVRRGSGAFVNL